MVEHVRELRLIEQYCLSGDVFPDVTDVQLAVDVLGLQSTDLLQDLQLLEDLCWR